MRFTGKSLCPIRFSHVRYALVMKPNVVIYSKPGCHLCDEAKAAIEGVRRKVEFTLEEVNIEGDAELTARYQYDIPVIAINGVDTFMHRVDLDEFRERLLKYKKLSAAKGESAQNFDSD